MRHPQRKCKALADRSRLRHWLAVGTLVIAIAGNVALLRKNVLALTKKLKQGRRW